VDKNGKIMERPGARASARHWAFVVLCGFFCLLSAATSSAQSSTRWLLVYNTSASMRDRTQAVQAVTQDLLATAMHGTIRPGDTIGIWTYNTELHADEAPLQTWSPNAAPGITYNTLLFLRQHRYEKSAAFGEVLTNMLRVISISDVITVILISDGNDPISGTPFDARVAAFYKENAQKQKKARMPVVTVFRGERGAITTNTLALAPWPVDIPAVPLPRVVAQAAAPKPIPPPKPVPSLVIIGKKAETTFNPPADFPEHAGEPAPQPVAIPAASEPAPAAVKTEAPAEAKTETAAAAVKVETAKPAEAAPVAATTAPAAGETPKPVQTASTPTAAAPEAAQPSPPAAAPVASPIVIQAASVPEKNLLSVRNIAVVSVTFTLLVCGLLFLSARNARRATRSSLITRSLDRER
jgi:hypothetical protein